MGERLELVYDDSINRSSLVTSNIISLNTTNISDENLKKNDFSNF